MYTCTRQNQIHNTRSPAPNRTHHLPLLNLDLLLPTPFRRSSMDPNHTPTLRHASLAARPPEPARKPLILHQRPRISQHIRIELVPHFVVLVDFAFSYCVDWSVDGFLIKEYWPGNLTRVMSAGVLRAGCQGVLAAAVATMGHCFPLVWARFACERCVLDC